LTGDQLKAKDGNYGTNQIGTLIYATSAVAVTSPKTINVNAPGYYYFDGEVWNKLISTIVNNGWTLVDTAMSSTINSRQNLNLVTEADGPYEEVSGTKLTVTIPPGYSQNKIILRWDVWGASHATGPGISQGSLRYAVRQQMRTNTPTQINSIMMSGWNNGLGTQSATSVGPRWNAPVAYTVNNLPAGVYNFDLMIHREAEDNARILELWGSQGKADVFVK